jgi:excisionase family DNA binding protein
MNTPRRPHPGKVSPTGRMASSAAGSPLNKKPAPQRLGVQPAPKDILVTVLTSQGAADLVGVSRPYLVRFIDNGAIPQQGQVGNQRRVLKSDVLAWWEKERVGRRQALKRLAEGIAEELPD